MGIDRKVLLLLVAAAGLANCATAAPAAPRINSYAFSGAGCGSNETINLKVESSRLIAEMPLFSAEMGPSLSVAEVSPSSFCQGHYDLVDSLPGYRLAVKSITHEGYLYSRGGVRVSTFERLFWSRNAAHTWSDERSYTFNTEKASLRVFRETYQVPVEYASECGRSGLVTIGWNIILRPLPGTNDSSAAFLGIEGSPPKTVIDFAWLPCDGPAVSFET